MATHFRSGLSIGPKNTGQEWASLRVYTATVNPASLATGTSNDTAVTVTGVLTTDYVQAIPPAALEAGINLSHAWANAADSITVRVSNVSAGTVDAASATWTFMVWRRTS